MACAAATALGGCGGDGRAADPALAGRSLTIYSSLPLRGPLAATGADVRDGQRLALAHAGGRVGQYRVRLRVLDASSPTDGRTDPSRVSENARLAKQDPTTVAYLGELATGMSAISIPLLNEAGILQVSPLDSAMTLTTGSVAATGTPERFYPRLEEVGRTFARVAPSDRTQAVALLALMRREGVRRLAALTDEDPSGRALATWLRALARERGVAVVAREEIDVHARAHDDAIARIVATRPDAVLDATGGRAGSARLWRELHRAIPDVLLLGPASLADPAFVSSLGTAASAARVTLPLPAPTARRSEAERRFARAFARRHGRAPSPAARFGYESMRSTLAAIARAARGAADGRVRRATVVREYFRTAPRATVLGAYAITPSGDSTLRWWGGYEIVGGTLRLRAVLDGAAAVASAQE